MRTIFSLVILRFTDGAHEWFGTGFSQVTGLITVKANRSVASVGEITKLGTVTACARLSGITKINENFAKSNKIRNGPFETYSVVADSILN